MKTAIFVFASCVLLGTVPSCAFTPNLQVASKPSSTAIYSLKAREAYKRKVVADWDAALVQGIENVDKDELDALRVSQYLFGKEQPNPLAEMISDQLRGSSMIYTFAAVRDYVRDTRDTLDWFRPELILTQHTAQDAEKDRTSYVKHVVSESLRARYLPGKQTYRSYLKRPITADAVFKFITNKKNAKLLSESVEAFDRDQWAADFNVLATLRRLTEIDGDVVEFDDQFDKKQLVYALTVNRTNKRMTVCFRGSVLGGRDWPTNLNMLLKTIDTPEVLKDDFKGRIRVHNGFNRYLNDRKFNDILGQILHQYENPLHKDYELHICGHSLGGALSALLGFHLASSGKLLHVLDGKPIKVISFASPQVGDDGYNKAFQALESKGYLQHVRVSSQGDVVPVSPTGFGVYTQTGINLHLHEKTKMEVGYRNLKSLVSQLGFHPLDNHSPARYHRRLKRPANQDILRNVQDIEGLYEEYAGDFTD